MEEDFPRSAAEAQDHIRLIRREKGLGDGPDQIGNNAADLESALKVLSNDLYQTATHFLLELIQNADDNFYTAEVPTLSISYSKGRVRIDCNERGFNKKNIEAICRICQSTKSGSSKSAGFVGEKGIGFKAVFKVASTVWISSGYYSFRFDRDAHLGMIAPIWDKFPEKPREGWTSIYLKLAKDCDENHIIDELRLFDEKILLFLRRLRRLEIDVKPSAFKLTKPFFTTPFETILSRQGGSSEQASDMVLMNNGVKKHYFVWRHLAKRMPKDSRRPGISQSDVVLVFPNTGAEGDQVRPVIEEQSVYAFLPIRKAGFNFLLQADFLLSANREDVHVDSAWNKSLSLAAAVAYVDAVLHMGNFSKGLRYTWPSYIPNVSAKTQFFENLRQDIVKRLKQAKAVMSQAGCKTKAEKIIQVPAHMLDPSGTPFMINEQNKKWLLASGYDSVEYGYGLNIIGVNLMSNDVFYREMGAVLKSRPEEFLTSKTKEWHGAFARALAKTGYPSTAASIPIIPLRNGKWASSGAGVFFPENEDTSDIPEGIQFLIVDPEAAADPDRRALFVKRGVNELTDYHINNKIRFTHQDDKFDPNSLAPEVLVSHARFLFKIHTHESQVDLWMAATEGQCRRAEAMYIPSHVRGAASSQLPRSSFAGYGFLHPAYIEADEDPLWHDYLKKVLRISIYPRLYNPPTGWNSSQHDYMHADFKLLMQYPYQKWLTILRDGWEFYKDWLDPEITSSSRNVSDKLVEQMRDYKVRCTGAAGLERLKNAYMPLERLTREYGNLAPFLTIPDLHNPLWKPLMEALGVRTRDDVDFYLHCLNGAKRNPKVSGEKIRQIMHEIEAKVEAEPSSITPVLEAMNGAKLIHIPPPGKDSEGKRGTWVSRSDCFWRGESWLTQSVGLERRHADLEVFFRTQLQIPNAGLEHYIREATAISQLPPPIGPQVEKLLTTITAHVKLQGISAAQKTTLQELEILPIAPGAGESEYLTSVNSNKLWLIADRENFRTQFEGVLPLLAFKAEFILKIKPLLRVLGLQDRFLSDLATCVTEAHGEAKLHNKLTLKYRGRSKYLFRLTPENQADVQHLRAKFRSVDVYVAPKIIQYWRAPLGLSNVCSPPHDGAAFLESDYAGDLRIYLRDDAEQDAYPYELAEQLRNFFNIPDGDRDLLAAAMTAPEERVDQLFEARGVPPLLEEDAEGEEAEWEEGAAYAPVQFPPPPSKKKSSRLGGDSRVSRLLSSTRFGPSFFKQDGESSPATPPTYNVAVARSTQNAIGRPVEPRTFASAITLPSLKSALNDLEFVQKPGVVVGTPRGAPTMLDRFRRLTQRDDDFGERMVSDILAAVLGPQYDKSSMWKSRPDRKRDPAAFNFQDTQGRFSAFLMRLEGLPGKAQGYTRLTYHLLVKATDGESFKISQEEIARAREYSVHNQPDPEKQAPSKHVSVLVHISDTRGEPKIRFLADPWDLFEDGQLILANSRAYDARLALRLRRPIVGAGRGEAGFDAIQIRQHGDPDEDEDEDEPSPRGELSTRPEKGKGRWKGKGKVGAEEPSPRYEEKTVNLDETRTQVGEA